MVGGGTNWGLQEYYTIPAANGAWPRGSLIIYLSTRPILNQYFGSGAVLFNKQPAVLETINDISGEVVNLFRIIR
ncbi:hypothetical protein D3C78_619040 [compost metagenome]